MNKEEGLKMFAKYIVAPGIAAIGILLILELIARVLL